MFAFHSLDENIKENKVTTHQEPSEWGNAEKWKKLLEENDPKKIWKSIGWNGSIESSSSVAPSDEEFRVHFIQNLRLKAIEATI